MPQYQAGVAGPIPLEDGRVVAAEQGSFELEVTTPHDEDLVERGVIVLVEQSTPPSTPAPPAAPATTPPTAKAVGNADSGGE